MNVNLFRLFMLCVLGVCPMAVRGDNTQLLMSMYNRVNNVGNVTPDVDNKYLSLYRSANSLYLDAKIEKLQQEYDAARAREQSIGNRMLGAAGMATMGIGGMELASGLAEKRADEAAEQDMKAYLETIKCDYGHGLNIRGGETNIELPGGNELIDLRGQYVALAADLKVRKEALGLKLGLESELILDKAATGLYDDVGTGITGGAYTSLSRALMDENGDDANAWNGQKESSQNKIKTGAIVAGAGAGVTTIGNVVEGIAREKQNKTNAVTGGASPDK